MGLYCFDGGGVSTRLGEFDIRFGGTTMCGSMVDSVLLCVYAGLLYQYLLLWDVFQRSMWTVDDA